jgi:hypothetical protein
MRFPFHMFVLRSLFREHVRDVVHFMLNLRGRSTFYKLVTIILKFIIIIINGTAAQSRALASHMGFVMILRCGLSAPRSTILVILIRPPETSSGEATIDI